MNGTRWIQSIGLGLRKMFFPCAGKILDLSLLNLIHSVRSDTRRNRWSQTFDDLRCSWAPWGAPTRSMDEMDPIHWTRSLLELFLAHEKYQIRIYWIWPISAVWSDQPHMHPTLETHISTQSSAEWLGLRTAFRQEIPLVPGISDTMMMQIHEKRLDSTVLRICCLDSWMVLKPMKQLKSTPNQLLYFFYSWEFTLHREHETVKILQFLFPR